MKREYENVKIEILNLQANDIIMFDSVDATKENIGAWDDSWLNGIGGNS